MSKVSVIIPVYNAEKVMERCIESLLNQTFRDFEIIFVDDGSTDQSLTRLKSMNFHDILIEIQTQSNQGQGVARNLGVCLSKGEFICFVDIDDYIVPDMLEKLIAEQNRTNADIVWCNASIIENGSVISTLDHNMMVFDDPLKSYIVNNAGPCRKIIKADILKSNDLSFPSIRFYEDVAVVPAYGLVANSISYIKDPLYNYEFHEGSTMHQNNYDIRLEDIFKSLDILYEHFSHFKQILTYSDCLEFLYIDHLLHAASLRFYQFEEGKEPLVQIQKVMKERFPNWSKNKILKQKTWKYKLICKLFYRQQYGLLRRILK